MPRRSLAVIEATLPDRAVGTSGQATAWSAHGWVAVGRERPLLVPRAPAVVRRYGIEFFVWRNWQRWLCRTAATAGMHTGSGMSKPAGVPLAELQMALAEAWSLRGATPELLHLFLRAGTDGPLKKISALAVDNDARHAVFAKVAQGGDASIMVDREARTLKELARIPELRGFVPQALAHGTLRNSRSYVLTTVAPSLGSGLHLDARHQRFLAVLWRATVQWGPLLDTLQAQRLWQQRQVCDPYLPDDVKALVDRCLALQADSLSGVEGPSVLIHRDFAPWNLKADAQGIYVFDWEYAEPGGSPLHDLLHFALVPAALGAAGKLRLSVALNAARAAAYAVQNVFPSQQWPAIQLRGSLLSYLLDTLLFYVCSDRRYQDGHPVLRTYRAWLEDLCREPVARGGA